jgi:membrane protease YdiL (CAAX protease family)
MKNLLLKTSKHIWLFCGLLLVVLSLIVLFVLRPVMPKVDDPIVDFIKNTNGWYVLFYVVLLGPIFEEFAFRFWAIKYKWGKIVSSVLIFFYLWMAWNNIYLSGICSLVFVFFAFILNKFRFKKGLLILYTSILFACMHINNFTENNTFFFAVPFYIGMSFILCYLVSHFSFIFAVAGHGLWNLIILFVAGFLGNFTHPVTLSNNNFDTVITNVSALSNDVCADSISDNYIYLSKKSSADIISSLYPSTYKIENEDPSLLFYTLEVKGNIDKNILIQEVSKSLDICLDTVEKSKDGFEIVIADENLFSREQDSGFTKMNITGFVNSIESRTNYWVDVADSIRSRVFFMDINILLDNTGADNDMDNMIYKLKLENGIALLPKNVKRDVIKIYRIQK